MKKIFTLLFVAAFALNTLAQSYVMTHDTSHCSGDPASLFTCDNYVTNNTGAYSNMKWTRYAVDMPAGWETTVCDKNNCYSTTTDTKNFSLDNSQSGFVKVNFIPNGTPGVGVIRINVSSLDETYSTDAYFVGTAPESVGINNPEMQEVKDIFLYPTPVRENVYVVFNPGLRPDRIDIHNVLGQKVKTFPIALERNNYRTELPLSDLDKGLYFLRVYQNGTTQVYTKQFTKE